MRMVLQLLGTVIIVVLRSVGYKAAHINRDMRLPLIGFDQKIGKMFPGGGDFVRNLPAAEFNEPDGVVLTAAMPFGKITNR